MRAASARPLRRAIAAATLGASLMWAGAVQAYPRTFEVDPEFLFVTFLIGHDGYAKMVGQFLRGRGSFAYDVETQTIDSGSLTLYSKSVFTGHYERDKLLRSADFLNVSEYPRIVFEFSNFEPTGKGSGQLTGHLSMLGETQAVTFEVTVNRVSREGPNEPYVLGASARATLARSRWSMTLGDRMLSDGVSVIVELEAYQTSE